jgi:uncharacterized membrane protein
MGLQQADSLNETSVAVDEVQRDSSLRRWMLIVLVFCLIVSGYLSYVKLTNVPMVCVENGPFNCEVVQNSSYSRMFGYPIAWYGLATNILLVVLLLLENRVQFLRDYGVTIIFGIVLFAFLFSVWLVYVQAALLQAYCPWCLTHEVLITILFIFASIRMKRSLSA